MAYGDRNKPGVKYLSIPTSAMQALQALLPKNANVWNPCPHAMSREAKTAQDVLAMDLRGEWPADTVIVTYPPVELLYHLLERLSKVSCIRDCKWALLAPKIAHKSKAIEEIRKIFGESPHFTFLGGEHSDKVWITKGFMTSRAYDFSKQAKQLQQKQPQKSKGKQVRGYVNDGEISKVKVNNCTTLPAGISSADVRKAYEKASTLP